MTSYRHTKGTRTRIVDGEAFLITQSNIRHLSPTATIMWLAFEPPASQAEALALLQGIYTGVDRKTLARDLKRLVISLMAEKLLQPLSAPAARRATHRRSTGR